MNEKKRILYCIWCFVGILCVLAVGFCLFGNYTSRKYNSTDKLDERIKIQQRANIKRAREIHETISEVRTINERTREINIQAKRVIATGRNSNERIGEYARANEQLLQRILTANEK